MNAAAPAIMASRVVAPQHARMSLSTCHIGLPSVGGAALARAAVSPRREGLPRRLYGQGDSMTRDGLAVLSPPGRIAGGLSVRCEWPLRAHAPSPFRYGSDRVQRGSPGRHALRHPERLGGPCGSLLGLRLDVRRRLRQARHQLSHRLAELLLGNKMQNIHLTQGGAG